MTFDEWWKEMKPAECDELKDEFVCCWTARDVEIAELHKQITKLQGQVGLLLRTAKALAATEPKL